ncbi:uncharacterized protein LOC116023727 [Ipomoea triloba]|uniref:uncharacterized protein LOC116023727 n=1 Tax=Ipomoea triloba TaxID=35885 RepID=UPI00125CDBCA|nr:uncharacterized protein LOC116023727 [Ipomoea triloba]
MAAALPAAAPTLTRSFADVLSSNSSATQPRPIDRYKGMPVVSFSDEDIQQLALRFKFALIGKFTKSRPSMALLRKSFDLIGFGGAFTLGLIDQRHVLINFDKEEDFQRCWLRKSWSIQGSIMKIFKWTTDFRPEVESPIVPVWIALEGLPAHLHDKRAIYSIAQSVGPPLKVDASTLILNRPSVARVCVELDVSNPFPENIWINHGSSGGFAQPVHYEYIPPYCHSCLRFGHLLTECKVSLIHKQSKDGNADIPIQPKPQTLQKAQMQSTNSVAPPRKRWRPVTVQPQQDKQIESEDHAEIQPGHLSEGDEVENAQNFSQSLLESWKQSSKFFASKLHASATDEADSVNEDFVTVTRKKRRPRKDYSLNSPSVLTRLAAGKIAKVSFSNRFK